MNHDAEGLTAGYLDGMRPLARRRYEAHLLLILGSDSRLVRRAGAVLSAI